MLTGRLSCVLLIVLVSCCAMNDAAPLLLSVSTNSTTSVLQEVALQKLQIKLDWLNSIAGLFAPAGGVNFTTTVTG